MFFSSSSFCKGFRLELTKEVSARQPWSNVCRLMSFPVFRHYHLSILPTVSQTRPGQDWTGTRGGGWGGQKWNLLINADLGVLFVRSVLMYNNWSWNPAKLNCRNLVVIWDESSDRVCQSPREHSLKLTNCCRFEGFWQLYSNPRI